MTIRSSHLVIVALACAIPTEAVASEAATGAARVYERAQSSLIDGDASRAAELFERADALAPSPVALRSAARARLAAGQRAAAATHAAALLERYPDDDRSRALGSELLAQLGPRLIRIDVACTPACRLELDGLAAGPGRRTRWSLYAEPASHRLAARFADGTEVTRRTFGGPGTELALRLSPPAVADSAPIGAGSPPAGLDRQWFALGVGATAALAGAALWSWSDADAARAIDPPLGAERSLAQDRERRAALLLGTSLVAATATAVLAIVTDWSGAGERPLTAAPVDGGAVVGLGGSF